MFGLCVLVFMCVCVLLVCFVCVFVSLCLLWVFVCVCLCVGVCMCWFVFVLLCVCGCVCVFLCVWFACQNAGSEAHKHRPRGHCVATARSPSGKDVRPGSLTVPSAASLCEAPPQPPGQWMTQSTTSNQKQSQAIKSDHKRRQSSDTEAPQATISDLSCITNNRMTRMTERNHLT